MIDFEHLANPEKYHTVPPRAEGEKDEQYKARLKAYVQGIKSQQAKIDELKKKLDCCREENKALLKRLAVYDKHVKAIKHIHETQFDENTDTSFILGNLDGFIEYLESDLRGNKDEKR